jgi:Arc/MetJ-type ribon-helix-helix transcriptional regulator
MNDMPLKLSEPLELFVNEQLRAGAYPSREAVINDAVSRLKKAVVGDEAKRARLRAAIAPAIERMDRGEGHVVDDLNAYADTIMAEATRS